MQLPDFKNEPLSDFKNNPAHRRRMEYALEEIREELGREYPRDRRRADQNHAKFRSIIPVIRTRWSGVFSQADAALADRAVL